MSEYEQFKSDLMVLAVGVCFGAMITAMILVLCFWPKCS